MSLRQVGVMLGVVFAIALAVVVGKQMSTEAMAVVVGVVCGVAAGIPTAVLLLVVLSRRETQRSGLAERQAGPGNYPPVVVIQGGAAQGLPSPSQVGYWPVSAPGPKIERQFRVVGEDDLILGD